MNKQARTHTHSMVDDYHGFRMHVYLILIDGHSQWLWTLIKNSYWLISKDEDYFILADFKE